MSHKRKNTHPNVKITCIALNRKPLSNKIHQTPLLQINIGSNDNIYQTLTLTVFLIKLCTLRYVTQNKNTQSNLNLSCTALDRNPLINKIQQTPSLQMNINANDNSEQYTRKLNRWVKITTFLTKNCHQTISIQTMLVVVS